MAPFVVGCGHAVRSVPARARIVRLSDGRSWLLENREGTPWRWSTPIAVTCDELFIRVSAGGKVRLARIRLSALGPGLPPD